MNGIDGDRYDPEVRERLLDKFRGRSLIQQAVNIVASNVEIAVWSRRYLEGPQRAAQPIPITHRESLELALLGAIQEIERLRKEREGLKRALKLAYREMVTQRRARWQS